MESIDPVIRNDLLMLFSAQNAEALATREGKEKLRADSLELVRKAVKNAGGNPGLVENVLFTSFVMQ
jgi:flagellar FliL protein